MRQRSQDGKESRKLDGLLAIGAGLGDASAIGAGLVEGAAEDDRLIGGRRRLRRGPGSALDAEAVESADEEGVFSLAFRLRFCRSSVPTRIKVSCRVSKVIADAIECSVDDPDQGKLPL